MATLYVLKVPEFDSLCEAASRKSGLRVEDRGNYSTISARSELLLTRIETGLGKAVWFGALTGGYDGRVTRFDDEELRIVDV